MMPPETQRAIDAFLSQDSGDENVAVAAPEANAFSFQSQGIVDMLAKLQAKFEDERTALEKDEKNAMQSFEMVSMDLKSQVDNADRAKGEKTEAKAKALETVASATGDLA